MIYDQGTEVLLGVGTHVFNSGTVTFAGTNKYNMFEHLQHGRFNYVRVTRGKLARVWAEVKGPDGVKSVQPRLLKEGEHFAESHLFKFDGMSMVSDTYIAHGSVHRISVQKGFVAMVYHDNKPRLLGEGDHVIESTAFTFNGTEDIMQSPCIVHGTITILRVTRGTIAMVWQDNEPTFIDEPGLFEFDSPDFAFAEFKNAEEQLIQLGAKKIILVHTGQVAVTYDQGRLKILTDGRHTIDSATHVFHRFLSTQQRSIRLATVSREYKMAQRESKKNKAKGKSDSASVTAILGPDSDLTICETKDLVKVGLRAGKCRKLPSAICHWKVRFPSSKLTFVSHFFTSFPHLPDVFYSIEDPEKCIQRIDTDELEDLVQETAIATLTNIIRSTALNEIAQSKNVSAGEIKDSGDKLQVLTPPPGPDAPPPTAPVEKFFDKVHDDFLDRLNEDFRERYGVDIANIRIESFKIMDEELSNSIAKHALTTAQIENELANLEGASIISTTRETTAAQVMKINAEAEAAKKKTAADAENQRQVDAAEASAKALKIEIQSRAQAEAEAILIKAKAEAEAIRLKAEAEAKRAEMLSRTTLGQQEALLAKYAEMVVGANEGVDKVIYMDPSVNRDSPFALGSLQNLNYDLHALSKIGIATGQATAQLQNGDA